MATSPLCNASPLQLSVVADHLTSSPPTSIHRSTSSSRKPFPPTVYSRTCKALFRNSSSPDFSLRVPKNPGDRRIKESAVIKKSLRRQQNVGITADVQENRQDTLTEQVVLDDLHGQEGRGVDTSKIQHFSGFGARENTLKEIGKNAVSENDRDAAMVRSLHWEETIQNKKDLPVSGEGGVVDKDIREKDEQLLKVNQRFNPATNSRIKASHAEDWVAHGDIDRKTQSTNTEEKNTPSDQGEVVTSMENERHSRYEMEMQRSSIINLAERNTANKIFFYPESVKVGSQVEIFFNRSITTLADQSSILALGSFNDWRWKSFLISLRKTDLSGDWWSCKLEVPNDAYKIDFVFFDGEKLYENNSGKDFFMLVEDGMEKDAFEDFLMEEKRKELERLAAEEAEKERKAAEEHQLAEAKAAEEADRAEARRQMNEQRERARRVLQKAMKNLDGLWNVEPSDFQGGETVKLFYNRSSRPLASSKEVWIHGGYNNWRDLVSIVGKLSFSTAVGGDWWSVDVEVPEQAYFLNFVFADGPPNSAVVYDNNSYQDFHAIVPKGVPDDLYWVEIEQNIFLSIQEDRRKREEAVRRKDEYTARMKEELKAKTKQKFLQSLAHILYTDPRDVQAGKPVTVYYNPSNTILNGRPEVWLRGSFNRWTHKKGSFTPVKMDPSGNTTHVKATVRVPLDAYMMDFVFSEYGGEHGGMYDNRNGLDYHVPVVGGIVKEPPMEIVHISVEMAPIAKVGGLGDVVTSLSRAVQDLGHNVEVMLPKYDCLNHKYIQDLQEREAFFLDDTRIKVWNGKVEGLSVNFLEPENGMFGVGCIYGRRDDEKRFGFFCHAALEFLLKSGRHPDIIHCHDWSSAHVAWLFRESYMHYGLSNAHIVFSIHNLEFGTPLIGKAMAHAHKATTVSETYAQEVSGNPAIAPYLHKFSGIRNGIDPDIWDPYNDPFIPMSYTSEQVVEGKKAAKEELQRRLGLVQWDRPLVGIITRLTAQKGIHLIKHAIGKTMERGGQVVLLGSAPDPRIQNDFSDLADQLHNSSGNMARLCLHYDEPLSHLIYAGADFILIPSMFEPCGLTQLIAMRYGAIPVVRRTGGLNDTVFDVDHGRNRAHAQGIEPNGFSFDGADAAGLDGALNSALSAWYNGRDWFNMLRKRVMEQDWTWNRPALDYVELYYHARK